MAESSGPEKYAPPDRRPLEKQGEADRVAFLHRQRSELQRSELDADACAASLAGIHVGRIDHTARGGRFLELLVVDS